MTLHESVSLLEDERIDVFADLTKQLPGSISDVRTHRLGVGRVSCAKRRVRHSSMRTAIIDRGKSMRSLEAGQAGP